MKNVPVSPFLYLKWETVVLGYSLRKHRRNCNSREEPSTEITGKRREKQTLGASASRCRFGSMKNPSR